MCGKFPDEFPRKGIQRVDAAVKSAEDDHSIIDGRGGYNPIIRRKGPSCCSVGGGYGVQIPIIAAKIEHVICQCRGGLDAAPCGNLPCYLSQ